MNKGILQNCKAKLKAGNSHTNIINYLFSMDIEEAEVIAIFEKLGVDKATIKDLLVYNFGLDYEIIMAL